MITSVATVGLTDYHSAVQACIVQCIYHYQHGQCWRGQMLHLALQGPRTTIHAALQSIHQLTDGVSH